MVSGTVHPLRYSIPHVRRREADSELIAILFGQVLSSIIAAWSDISNTYASIFSDLSVDTGTGVAPLPALALKHLHGGYVWMFLNCISSAGYVRLRSLSSFVISSTESNLLVDMRCPHQVLTMRKKIKSMGFSDWDTMFYNNTLSIPVLLVFSIITEDWGTKNLGLNL
jgi:GDP-mannose transporter